MNLTGIKKLLAETTSSEAEQMSLEVYNTSGQKFNVVDVYIDDDVLCLDIEKDPEAA